MRFIGLGLATHRRRDLFIGCSPVGPRWQAALIATQRQPIPRPVCFQNDSKI